MAEITIHSNCNMANIFQVYTRSSEDIVILIFCTSLRQCKVNVGCICSTLVRRKLQFFINIISRISEVIKDSLCNQL